jgi:pimeloyl-ACP methyl ester carboxylesterase
MKKFLSWTAGILIALSAVFFLGPKSPEANLNPELPVVPSDLVQLEMLINTSEKAVKNLKPNNEARIVWADSLNKKKTPYSIVYIHGFGASWAEGDPVAKNIAKRYGANLYLSRMHDAGISDPDAFDDLTPENFTSGAKQALAIGKALGDSVIIIGTSAGGLLTIHLASNHPELKGIVLYSPCLAVANPALKLTTGPWGEQILHAAMGEHRNSADEDPGRAQFWLQSYHTNGLLTLQKTIDAVAQPEVFSKVTVPAFVGYYYKNEKEQDDVVSVKAIQDMVPLLGTTPDQKVEKAFPESGDHVIASYLRSKDVAGVQKATEDFFDQILKIKPVQ